MSHPINALVEDAMAHRTDAELALGWVRYEALRRVTVTEFKAMSDRCLKGQRFDDQVDELATRDVTRGGGK